MLVVVLHVATALQNECAGNCAQLQSLTCLLAIFTKVQPDKPTAVVGGHSQFLKRLIPENVRLGQVNVVGRVQQREAVLVVYHQTALLSLPLHHCNTQRYTYTLLHTRTYRLTH